MRVYNFFESIYSVNNAAMSADTAIYEFSSWLLDLSFCESTGNAAISSVVGSKILDQPYPRHLTNRHDARSLDENALSCCAALQSSKRLAASTRPTCEDLLSFDALNYCVRSWRFLNRMQFSSDADQAVCA